MELEAVPMLEELAEAAEEAACERVPALLRRRVVRVVPVVEPLSQLWRWKISSA